MYKDDLKDRFRNYSISIVRLVNAMPITNASNAIAKQIICSGTSPYANYRAACVGKSEKDFINKLKMVEEELDETSMWLDIIMSTDILPTNKVEPLYNETIELLKIIVSSIKTMKQKQDNN